MTALPSPSTADTVLLDIEGTICPIDFVKQTLFPYAINALPKVLSEKWDDPAFVPYREAFPADARSSPQAFQAHVEDLTRRDVKIAYLKNLQGYLWQEGYESRSYSTPLFEDVLPALERWKSRGVECSIYSSGSVFAQKLLFAHVRDTSSSDPRAIVDRRSVVREWFDTVNAGPKTESASYAKIADELGVAPGRVLFFSDNVSEIHAALKAGLQAVLVDRPGNAELSHDDRQKYSLITSFEQL